MPLWKPDLLSLRLFVAVCEEASIARAADRESIVASAISKRIAEMEQAVGVALLVRNARGVQPTAAGTALLGHAQQMLLTADRMQVEIAEFGKGVRGHVRVLANISSIVEFLPRDLSAFLAVQPHIRIDLQERLSRQVPEGVREGQGELGVCLSSVDLSDLEVHPYAQDRLGLVVHAAHPLAGRDSVTFEETLDYDFVALNPESATTRRMAGVAARMGRTIRRRMYVSTFEAACYFIAENLAIGILAVNAVKPFQSALALRVVRLEEEWAQRDMVLVHRRVDLMSRPARALLEHLNGKVSSRNRP